MDQNVLFEKAKEDGLYDSRFEHDNCGVGIMLQISHKFFKKVTKPLGFDIGGEREYGVGMFFMPQDELKRNREMKMFEIIAQKEGLEFLGWREVPVHPEVLGTKALECSVSLRNRKKLKRE